MNSHSYQDIVHQARTWMLSHRSSRDHELSYARGHSVAILMADAGVAVAPLDRKTLRPLAGGSADIHKAEVNFRAFPESVVGYYLPGVKFYAVVSTCSFTLLNAPTTEPKMIYLRQLVARDYPGYQDAPAALGKSVNVLLRRQPDDEIVGFSLYGKDADEGDMTFVAGWARNGRGGVMASDTGWFPVLYGLAWGIAASPRFRDTLRSIQRS